MNIYFRILSATTLILLFVSPLQLTAKTTPKLTEEERILQAITRSVQKKQPPKTTPVKKEIKRKTTQKKIKQAIPPKPIPPQALEKTPLVPPTQENNQAADMLFAPPPSNVSDVTEKPAAPVEQPPVPPSPTIAPQTQDASSTLSSLKKKLLEIKKIEPVKVEPIKLLRPSTPYSPQVPTPQLRPDPLLRYYDSLSPF